MSRECIIDGCAGQNLRMIHDPESFRRLRAWIEALQLLDLLLHDRGLLLHEVGLELGRLFQVGRAHELLREIEDRRDVLLGEAEAARDGLPRDGLARVGLRLDRLGGALRGREEGHDRSLRLTDAPVGEVAHGRGDFRFFGGHRRHPYWLFRPRAG